MRRIRFVIFLANFLFLPENCKVFLWSSRIRSSLCGSAILIHRRIGHFPSHARRESDIFLRRPLSQSVNVRVARAEEPQPQIALPTLRAVSRLARNVGKRHFLLVSFLVLSLVGLWRGVDSDSCHEALQLKDRPGCRESKHAALNCTKPS